MEHNDIFYLKKKGKKKKEEEEEERCLVLASIVNCRSTGEAAITQLKIRVALI